VEQDLGALLGSAVRDMRRVSLLYIDLDDFKRVNDTFGHWAGDQVLRAFAARLQDCLRVEDLLGRIGGDEFVALVQEGGTEEVDDVAERIRAIGDEPHLIDGRRIRVRASVGVASLPGDGRTLIELLQVADRRMYREKDDEDASRGTGRERVGR
jgi:diguanylate cyclase (GGDEF)-like protein